MCCDPQVLGFAASCCHCHRRRYLSLASLSGCLWACPAPAKTAAAPQSPASPPAASHPLLAAPSHDGLWSCLPQTASTDWWCWWRRCRSQTAASHSDRMHPPNASPADLRSPSAAHEDGTLVELLRGRRHPPSPARLGEGRGEGWGQGPQRQGQRQCGPAVRTGWVEVGEVAEPPRRDPLGRCWWVAGR